MTIQQDNLRSFVSGLGDPLRDKASSLVYMDRILTDTEIRAAYRNTWLAKKIIDIPALDALRKWRDWQADQKQITLIEAEEKRLKLQLKLLQCKTQARLWGGACIFMGIDSQDPSEPLEIESIKKGSLKYLTVLNRREVIAGELEQDPENEFYGTPSSYEITNGRSFATIHPSRLMVQIGAPTADPWIADGQHLGWGDSILQAIFTAIQNADGTAANVASLVFEANVDVFAVPGLMEQMSSKVYREKLLERFTLAAAGKSITKALIRDTEEEYERNAASFAGLPDVMQQFILLVSGAADIPLTRLLGQSPAGLSSTGEHDMKNYYDRVTSIQTLEIQPAMSKLDEVLKLSALGSPDEEVYYTWTPLEQMSEKEEAEIGKANAETADILTRTGLFMPEELREVVGNQFVESGLYPGLADLLKTNGNDIPEFDLEMRGKEAGVAALENPQPKEVPVKDARPLSLYLRRDILNGEEIAAWYKAQGVPEVYAPESMHTTIVYSKTPIDWMKMGEPWDARLEVPEGGPRLHEKFGAEQDVLVLLYKARELDWRHEQSKELGASYDFDEYQSHISISLRANEIDLANIKPWQGSIILGPEVYEEIELGNWKEKVVTS